MDESRREFLKKSGGCALGMVSLATQMHHLGTMSAMAQKVIDSRPEGGANYKALVLLYWAGGNDGNNMVIPNHNDATISSYSVYSAARNTQGLAIPQPSLLPINVPRMAALSPTAATYGLHPNLGPLTQNGTTIVNNGIHELWGAGKLAIVTNVGNLVQPLTKANYLSSLFKKPYQLFSHSDQVAQSHTSNAKTQAFTGWGGRVSDKLTSSSNPNGLIPMITSISGAQLFTAGQTTLPMAIADSGTALANVLDAQGFGNLGGPARLTAFNALRGMDLSSNYVAAASHVTDLAIQADTALGSSQDTSANVTFPNTSIGRQLRQIARLIRSRDGLNINRQIFYCQVGSFDTHTNQPTLQGNLMTQVSQAVRAFWDELGAPNPENIQDKVVLFTLSDFARTFNPAGSGATVGSDHAWGNHMFVLGGQVLGGDFYGSKRPDGTGNYYPSLVMGPSGPDDTDNSQTATANRGRWIPTTSVEQYAVRLARWFGLDPADEAAVFPNLVNFNDTQTALNFLP